MTGRLYQKILLFCRRAKNSVWTENFISMPMSQLSFDQQIGQEQSLNPPRTYKAGDIVYVLFDPAGNSNAPYLGHPREIDCKVISGPFDSTHYYIDPVTGKEKRDTIPSYLVISGNGEEYVVASKFLIPASEVSKYRTCEKYVLNQDTELCPKDTIFLAQGNYLACDQYGIYIERSRFEKIKHLFT